MRVVVSFTTVPSRIERISPMIRSIEAQTRKPDRFVLWLPAWCRKEGAHYPKPSWRARHDLEVVECHRDWGPATKLMPTLEDEQDPDTLIVTVDDDVVYEPHAVEELEAAAQKRPRFAVGFMGCQKGPAFIHAEKIQRPRLGVVTLGGYRGVAYRRKFFDDEIFSEMFNLLRSAPFVVDDQFISAYLKRKKIPRAVIRTQYPGPGGSLNFEFLGLGNGIHEGEDSPLVKVSLRMLHNMYKRKGWLDA